MSVKLHTVMYIPKCQISSGTGRLHKSTSISANFMGARGTGRDAKKRSHFFREKQFPCTVRNRNLQNANDNGSK